MKLIAFFSCLFFLSCSTIKYQKSYDKPLPELGSIGDYRSFALDSSNDSKTIPTLNTPVRISMTKIRVSERDLFKTKDKKSSIDSLLVGLEIIDKLSLIEQINDDKSVSNFLESNSNYEMISGVTSSFPRTTINQLKAADELYLVQKKEKTLSIELRKDNKTTGIIDFSDGKIVDIEASRFCWSKGDRGRVVITDIRQRGSNCSSGSYSTAQKAKKKTEFKF